MNSKTEVETGSARAPRAVFRALAENLGGTGELRTFWAVSDAKELGARRVQPHSGRACFPTPVFGTTGVISRPLYYVPKLISEKPLAPSLSPSDGERVAVRPGEGFPVSIRRSVLATVPAAGWLCLLLLNCWAPAFAYGPGCPWPPPVAAVLPSGTPDLFAAVKWCGILEAPTMQNPNLHTCRPDPKFALWGRHERASDGILIPQCRITLRSGAVGGHTNFKLFSDPDASTPNGDVRVTTVGGVREIDTVWNECDLQWNTPTPTPKGVLAVSVNRLVDSMGTPVGRGFGIVGSITRPYIAVADVSVGCELNERALAQWFCRVLTVPPDMIPGSLMNRTDLTGVTLTVSQCNTARQFLMDNPILDPPNDPNRDLPLDRVASSFDKRGDGLHPFLDIGKLVTVDRSPNKGSLSFHLAAEGLIPKDVEKISFWILLDRDNNPRTGANPAGLVPGTPMDGIDFVCEVTSEREQVIATLYELGEFGIFLPVLLPEGHITGVIHRADYEVIEPFKDYRGEVAIPAFHEIEFRVSPEGVQLSGLGAGGAPDPREGLFPRGLRLQSVASMPGVERFDMAPDDGAVQEFPRIEFPSLNVQPRVLQGEKVTVAVEGMPPNVVLKALLGPQMLPIQARTREDGSASFEMAVPIDTPLGPRLLTVGVDDRENAITADGVVEVTTDRPIIQFQSSPGKLVLLWQGTNYVMEASDRVTGFWKDFGVGVTEDGFHYSLNVEMDRPQRFYRLRSR